MTILHTAEKIFITDMSILPIYFYTNPIPLSKYQELLRVAAGSYRLEERFHGVAVRSLVIAVHMI